MADLDFEFNRDSLDLFPKDRGSNTGSGSGSKVHFAGLGSDRNSTTSGNSSNPTPGGDRHDVMAKYLYKRCQQSKWLEVSDHLRGTLDGGSLDLGVTIKRSPGSYTSEPLLLNPDVVRAVSALDAPVAFTMASEITAALFLQITPFQKELELDRYGCVLPIVNSVAEITLPNSTVSREAYMCLCRKEKIVLVWGDSVPGILAHGADVETIFVGMVWGAPIAEPSRNSRHASPRLTPQGTRRASPVRESRFSAPNSKRQSAYPSPQEEYFDRGRMSMPRQSSTDRRSAFPMAAISYNNSKEFNEKIDVIETALAKEDEGDKAFDPEKDGLEAPKRPFLLTHALLVSLAVILAVVVEMACVAKLIQETMYDKNMTRFALVATIPIFMSFSLFFMIVITGSLFQLFGPLSGVRSNSMYYSAVAPKPGRYPDLELPHITIQMPVYKEGLKGVVIPTISSLLVAIKNYEQRGGTASIFVNDDGMQLVKPDLQEARRAFYELNNVGWCSRPPHCSTEGENYFLRKGQFKKASNMNYCLDFSLRVEDKMLGMIDEECHTRRCTPEDLTIEEEDELYVKARDMIIEGDNGRTWAAGDVRLGEIILIIDSDTRVPEDCLIYGALEMHESPEVALLQHQSGILQVVNNAFENGISYFTNLIYTSIQFAVGNGDCAPFVGHNTFIRWKAIQSISWEEDGMTKFWSDSHVSEDFDVSLRLQMNGFVVRLATYHKGGFKEGVSLTVYDELARWEKYAYGCNELVFNPIIRWPTRGPFTKLFRRFLWSNIKITSKMTILAYIGTYYAIASAIPLVLANYLLVGWFQDDIDQFYLTSWKIFVGMAVVFNILSPLGYAMLRHRLGQRTFFGSLWETMKWTPMFLLFFGGISYHLFKAICCHFFSIKMEWTTTAKELEASGFRIGLDRIVRDFKWMYLFMVAMIAGVIYLGTSAPRGWTIKDFAAIVPLANQIGCHVLLPFALGLF